ncbi:MAG: DinB family protein [Acidobacteria bacterium]|nr:DinB family protein [Acidobacteriota bacterium]
MARRHLECVLLGAVTLLGLGQPASTAETISDADRAYLLAHLAMTQEFVVDATRSLTKQQWTFKPAPARWSIAQCVDHIAGTEAYVLKMVRERLMKGNSPIVPFPSLGGRVPPVSEKPERLPELADALLIRAMTDRTAAIRTPPQERPPVEEVAPRDTFPDPQAALDHFKRSRAATIGYVRTTQDDLRSHFGYTRLEGYYPRFKLHDGYQWLLRMSAHTERHLMQVQEIKRSEAFTLR